MAVYAVSDLHGYPFEKFLELLDKAGFSDDDFLFVLGDVIDRGEDGLRYLTWLMQSHNAQLILGNHEAMMLSCAFLFDEVTEESIDGLKSSQLQLYSAWCANGAKPTLDRLTRLLSVSPEQVEYMLEYLREAPLYETVTAGGRDFVLCHSGLGGFSPERRLSDYTADELIWTRPALTDRYFENGIMTVFGHTPTQCFGEKYRGRVVRTDTWICIDTGCGCGGAPMLLRLDDMAEIYCEEGQNE